MNIQQFLQTQFDGIIRMRSELAFLMPSHPEEIELDNHIEKLYFLLKNENSVTERGGGVEHPLGTRPHLNSVILFHIECCHTILRNYNNSNYTDRSFTINPGQLIYPSIIVTIWRRLLSLLLRIKIKKKILPKNDIHPKITEIVYLRLPYWFDLIFQKSNVRLHLPINFQIYKKR